MTRSPEIFIRPAFATDQPDKRGKIKKHYDSWLTPYEKFKSLSNAGQYLKPDFNFPWLDKIAGEKSDNQFAEELWREKHKLFKLISRYNKP